MVANESCWLGVTNTSLGRASWVDDMSDKSEMEFVSQSESVTQAFGRAIGLAGRAGDVVGLIGELGAGKTRLTKGVAEGLEVADEGKVRSPTFVLIREHVGRLRLFHVDAYRLSGAEELDSLGFEEILGQGGLTVVEWADHVAEGLPADRLSVRLSIAGPSSRRISLSCGGQVSRALLERLEQEWAKRGE